MVQPPSLVAAELFFQARLEKQPGRLGLSNIEHIEIPEHIVLGMLVRPGV